MGSAEVPAIARDATGRFTTLQGAHVSRFLVGVPSPGWRRRGRTSTWCAHRVRPGTLRTSTGAPGAGLAARRRCVATAWRRPNRPLDHPAGHPPRARTGRAPGSSRSSAAGFTLMLSPDPFRGFSGEGTLLSLLGDPGGRASTGQLTAPALGWQAHRRPGAQLAAATDLSLRRRSRAGLAWLSASGRLGSRPDRRAAYPSTVSCPSTLRRCCVATPRLTNARKLVGVVAFVGAVTCGACERAMGTRTTTSRSPRR